MSSGISRQVTFLMVSRSIGSTPRTIGPLASTVISSLLRFDRRPEEVSDLGRRPRPCRANYGMDHAPRPISVQRMWCNDPPLADILRVKILPDHPDGILPDIRASRNGGSAAT